MPKALESKYKALLASGFKELLPQRQGQGPSVVRRPKSFRTAWDPDDELRAVDDNDVPVIANNDNDTSLINLLED